jgi:hypothetical protein
MTDKDSFTGQISRCYARVGLAVAALLCLAAPNPGAAQQQQRQMNMPGMNMTEARPAAPYHPGLGELMTAFVQPRHIKLGLAGSERNWAYAAYELGELSETFDDVAALVPKHDNLSIPDAIAATVKQPMAALAAATKARNAVAFAKAYADLTASCNACHQSAGHPTIVIQVPTGAGAASPFPDQDFRPPPQK